MYIGRKCVVSPIQIRKNLHSIFLDVYCLCVEIQKLGTIGLIIKATEFFKGRIPLRIIVKTNIFLFGSNYLRISPILIVIYLVLNLY